MSNESLEIIRRALQGSAAESRLYSGADARPYLQQWIRILRYALPHAELWPETRALLLTVLDELSAAGRLADTLEWMEAGIEACDAREDRSTAARLKIELGRERVRQADAGGATTLLREGIAYFESEQITYAPALNALSHLALSGSRWDEAERLAQEALAALAPDEETWLERGQCYRNLGAAAHGRFQFADALLYFQEGLREWRRGGSPRYTAFGLVNVGSALRPLERYDEAEAHYLQGIAIFEEIGDPINRAFAQLNLGNVYLKTAQWERAIDQYYAAEQVLAHSRYRFPLARVYTAWGLACQGQGEWQRALRIHERNIDIWSELDNQQERANELDNMGVALMGLGRYQEAAAAFREGIEDARRAPPDIDLQRELREHLLEAEQRLRAPGDA